MSKRRRSPPHPETTGSDALNVAPNAPLYVQAYEANIIRSQPETAKRVEIRESKGVSGGLIHWQPDERKIEDKEIWVDRFDARLLLSSMPVSHGTVFSTHIPNSLSEAGWDDLPSDSEDTFFFTPEETARYLTDKRRRDMEINREARMRAIRVAEGEPAEEDQWGGSDEEPNATQLTLMNRTATHIITSPNPGQLEMRILANHGADPRFAFLRGRWKHAWAAAKAKVGKAKDPAPALGGLLGYESDGSESQGEEEEILLVDPALSIDDSEANANTVDEAEQERRRERARQWSSLRKARS